MCDYKNPLCAYFSPIYLLKFKNKCFSASMVEIKVGSKNAYFNEDRELIIDIFFENIFHNI